jgi:hypothetical protein
MKRYEYRHVVVPFTEQQLILIGVPLDPASRQELDDILEDTLNKYGREGWRIVPPLVLPIILLEREVIDLSVLDQQKSDG